MSDFCALSSAYSCIFLTVLIIIPCLAVAEQHFEVNSKIKIQVPLFAYKCGLMNNYQELRNTNYMWSNNASTPNTDSLEQ